MATAATDTNRAAVRREAEPAAVADRVVLAVAFSGTAVACFVSAFLAVYPALIKFSPNALATLAVPVRLGKTLEFALYVATFAVALPLSIRAADGFANRLEQRGRNATALAVVNLSVLLAVLATARVVLTQAPPLISPQRVDWVRPLAVGVTLALLVLVAANVLAWRRLPAVVLPTERRLPALVAVCALGAVVFLPHNALTPTSLVLVPLAAAVVAASRVLADRWPVRAVPRILEVGAVVVVAALAWDTRMPTGVALVKNAHYWNVYTGPANALLHGGAMYVDVFAQYGAGTYYLLAGVFAATTPGYGTFLITLAVIDTLMFLAGYAVARLGGARCSLAFVVACTAALTSILAGDTLVANRGLRLLVPLAAIICVQLRERYAERRAALSWALAGLVAVSSIIAAEVFFYTAAAAVGGLAASFRAAARDDRRLAVDARALVRLLLALVAAQLVFACCTRLFGGGWPQWLTYLEFQHYYVSGAGSQAARTFGPGVLLGAGYFVSAASVVGLFLWKRPFAARRRVELVSLASVSAAAIAFYSYMVGEAIMPNLHKMAPLAILLAGLWLALVFAERGAAPAVLTAVLAVATLWLVAVTLVADRHWLGTHVAHTALDPPRALDDLRHAAGQPRVTPETEAAERFVRAELGNRARLLLLLPDYVLPTELLMRLEKGAVLPISDPYEESFLPSRRAYLRGLAAELPLGTPLVTTVSYLATASPASTELDAELLSVLKQRFRLVQGATGPGGLAVYRLAAPG